MTDFRDLLDELLAETPIQELHTKKFHLTPDGRLEVYNHRMATKLNKYFKKYEDGAYVFKAGEEAVYHVPQNEYIYILCMFLSPKSKMSKELGL